MGGQEVEQRYMMVKEAVRKLKRVFTTTPVLAPPDMLKRFRIWVDTGTTKWRKVGGVISQWYGESERTCKIYQAKGGVQQWHTTASDE